MANHFERVAKRAAYPVEINGGTLYVKEPSYDEIDLVKAMTPVDGKDLRTGLTLALCVVNEDGSQAYSRQDGETDEQLASRVLADAKILGPSAIRKISDAIERLLKPAEPDELIKN